jgi:hypothetical protein
MTNPRPTEQEPTADPAAEPSPAEQAADPSNAKQRTGEDQAAINRENDPPA